MGDISKYFDRSEFACKCGCGYDDIDMGLVKFLDEIRELMNEPMKINSGCRCPEYNKKVGGKADSAHTKGKAADIATHGARFTYVFLALALRRFKRIGIYKTFCHVDVDKDLPQMVAWS